MSSGADHGVAVVMAEQRPSRTTVVIATRNRSDELGRTLTRLHELSPRPTIIVVDNGSRDGTVRLVRAEFPAVTLLRLPRNKGAVARNIGVRHAATPYVAFSDDDSWWAPGALPRAELAFEGRPRLAVVAARTLVGPDEREDPETVAMAASPLGRPPDLPGPVLLGFVACAAVVRRDAFLAAGGFNRVLFFPGEESLLAWDLTAAGWAVSYVDSVVAHHHPSSQRPQSTGRRALELRNALLTTWMRRPARIALAHTGTVVRQTMRGPAARLALAGTLRRLPAALARRRRLPASVESGSPYSTPRTQTRNSRA